MKTLFIIFAVTMLYQAPCFAGHSRCAADFVSAHDAQTGKDYASPGYDTVVKCHNVSTAEDSVYFYCRKDNGAPSSGQYPWSCSTL